MRTLFVLLLLLTSIARADATDFDEPWVKEHPSTVWPPVGLAANQSLNTKEVAFNFGVAYATEWAYYVYSQNQTIRERGSFNNWTTNWYQPHFDNDSFDYNIYKHSVTGSVYYQYYRSRGYDVKRAFLWAFLSSAAFEFTIETVTEKPSFQDLYQTPVYGTILGLGLEKLSQACHRTETGLGHVVGYLLDPFTLIPKSPKFAVYPVISHDKWIADMSWEF
jgi:hypothetical protein